MTQPKRSASAHAAARGALIDECINLSQRCVRLTGDLDRIEDNTGVGARYYAKLDELTDARQALGSRLRAPLVERDRATLRDLRKRLESNAAALHALEQAIADQVAQYIDDDDIRHELFVVPVLLPLNQRSSELTADVRDAIAAAWRRLVDGRDYPDEQVKVSVAAHLYRADSIYTLDEFSALTWNSGAAPELPSPDPNDAAPASAVAGSGAPLRAGTVAGGEEVFEHWDGSELVLRFIAIRVGTAPESYGDDDDDDPIPADDLRPYLPNFVDLPKSYLDWASECRKALTKLTRGHLNVGFPDDALAAKVTARYFTNFWRARFELGRQLVEDNASDDVADLTVTKHRGVDPSSDNDSAGESRLSLLDDDGDLLAGHRLVFDQWFTEDVAEPLPGDLAVALNLEAPTVLPELQSPPDDQADDPLFFSRSGWQRLGDQHG